MRHFLNQTPLLCYLHVSGKSSQRKGGYIEISKITTPKSCYYLLPEYYLRRFTPTFITPEQLEQEIQTVENEIMSVLKSRALSYDQAKYQATGTYQATEVPVAKILDCQGGNSGLTEEYIYSRILDTPERIYRILTGSTNYEMPQYIYKCKHPKDTLKDIATVEGKAVIHVVRKGKAGFAAFFDVGNYTLNDDAYLLYLKKDVPYKVDLKWLTYILKPQFLEYASSSDNGTWHKTAFFKKAIVDLPEYSEQLHIVKMYERLEDAERRLTKAQTMVGSLFDRQVSTATPSYA